MCVQYTINLTFFSTKHYTVQYCIETYKKLGLYTKGVRQIMLIIKR